MRDRLSDEEVLALTVYLEARGESEVGWRWVAWVIKNRVAKQRSYWGLTIKEVCLNPEQFECYQRHKSINIDDQHTYQRILRMCRELIHAQEDPTNGCDHYNNPTKEGYPAWTKNCEKREKIGSHQFYKGP